MDTSQGKQNAHKIKLCTKNSIKKWHKLMIKAVDK